MNTDLNIRTAAFNATYEKFKDRPFEWGKVDCIKVSRFLALQLKHKPPRAPRYTTEIGAIRSLKKMGFDNCEGLLSSMFPKIPVARALVGDLLIGDGEGGMDAVFISAGRQILGFHEDSDVIEFILPEKLRCAYRL